MDLKLNPNLDLIDWKRVTNLFQLVLPKDEKQRNGHCK